MDVLVRPSSIRSRRERLCDLENVARSCRISWGHVILPHLPVSGIQFYAAETQAGVVRGNHTVLLGGDIHTHDSADAPLLALFDEGIKHGEFHLALQHTAAHKPKVQLDCLVKDPPDQNRHKAVVAEFVGQAPIKRDKCRVARDGRDFRARISPGGEIKLIGLVDQLYDARQVRFVDGIPKTASGKILRRELRKAIS